MNDVFGSLARRAPQWAALGVAALAALLLTITVGVASRGVSDAASALARGEGEALLRALDDDLGSRGGPPTVDELAAALDRHRGNGLRYLAIVEPDVGHRVETGEERLRGERPPAPGQLELRDGRARLARPLHPPGGGGGPPPRGERPRGRPPHGDGPEPPPFAGPDRPPSAHPPLLVVEYEPLLVADLAASMSRARVVAALAVMVLLAVSGVLGLRIARAAEEERRGERERRLVALGAMSSVMAHELRNPLASLKGHAQLLAESLDEGTRHRAKAELVVSEAARLERLTRGLLDFVREGPLDLEPIAPLDLLERALAGVPAERLELSVEDTPPTLKVDEARLGMAIGNLVRNALEAAPEGRVEVRVHGAGETVRIDVRDHGPGLPPGEGDRIFDPFVTTRVKGTGLGLAVARRVVEQHGGTLAGETLPEGGARFRITLRAGADRPA